MPDPWKFYRDAMRDAFEAQQVIGMRMLMLGKGGPPAMLEAQRMVGEKALALWAAQTGVGWAMMRGPAFAAAQGAKPFGRTLRANRRRLARLRKG